MKTNNRHLMNTAALRLTMIFALSGLSWGLSAQQTLQTTQYYHNVGDTIYDSNAIYFWQWNPTRWIDSSRHNDMNVIPYYHSYYDDILRYCYTDHPINIIGIAGACMMINFDRLTPVDTMPRQEYLRIYDACPDSFPLKKEVAWHIAPPDRYLSLKTQPAQYECCDNLPISREVVPIYEFYFDDKPITVTDSFYVGGTMYSNLRHIIDDSTSYFNSFYAAYYSSVGFGLDSGVCPQCPRPHLPLTKYRSSSSPFHTHGQWYWEESERLLLIFPIIEIDTTYNPLVQDSFACPSVSGFQVASQSGQTTWLMWNSSSEHRSWQISYGEAGTAPGEGTTDSVSGPPIFSIIGLDSCRSYVAYVRAVCEHGDSTYFSDWSDPLDIYQCDLPASIEGSSTLDRFTQIIPSPASGTAQVVSSFQLQRIEVFNTAGTSVYDSSADGISHSIDVSGWESGFYFAVIHSSGGIVTKKLVVQ